MRYRLPLLAASIGLVLGGTVAAAYPAAATTSPAGGTFQPGGLMELSTGTQPAEGESQVTNLSTHTIVTSSNWAGYAATGSNGHFTSVAADWVQPTGHCTGGDQYAAFWVGLDGYSSSTVEQTGSEVDCVGRTAEYYAWWEMYPGGSEEINHTVKAGDLFVASVTYEGSNRFLLSLVDTTQRWTFTTTQTLAGAARSSAEVIAEAPCCTNSGGILPLTNFGTVNYTAAAVNSTHLCNTTPVEITMPDTSVSPLTSCENFSVTYNSPSIGFPRPFGGF
jgi:hypothetical protein